MFALTSVNLSPTDSSEEIGSEDSKLKKILRKEQSGTEKELDADG